MRNRILILVVLLIALMFSLSASAADPCGRDNQATCISEALTDFQSCCNTYGDAGCGTFCITAFNNQYNGCMILKGCADPPPPAF